MKKISKFKFRKKGADSAKIQRITNETVAEHREKILSTGRRFKYPIQYAKHKLVINAVVISILSLVIVAIVFWWQLYGAQNTSTFMYRTTRVVPLPVASVDGHMVRYSDYLKRFKSQEHYLINKQGVDLYAKDNRQQLDTLKRKSLDDAVADAYASKLASETGLTVTGQEIEKSIQKQRQSSDGEISEKAYFDVTFDHFGWTPNEIREVTSKELLKQKVSYKIDTTAVKLRDLVAGAISQGIEFDKIADSVGRIDGIGVEYSETPLVQATNRDDGLASHASKLNVGEVSEVFKSTRRGDGYYIVKLTASEGGKISYASIKVPLTVFKSRLSKLYSDKDVKEYIAIPTMEAIAKFKQ